MYNKVIKQLKKQGQLPDDAPTSSEEDITSSRPDENTGFHAKADSQEGATRARSIGNRMSKPPR